MLENADILRAVLMFRQVVVQGSFSGAARTLGLSPSAVSRQIGFLERHLGVVLFNRTTRALSLTAAGDLIYAYAGDLALTAETMVSAARSMAGTPRGRLRVTAPVTLGRVLLSPLVVRFIAAHPDVTIEVDLSDGIADLTAEAYDLALRVTSNPPQEYVARKIGPLNYVFVMAVGSGPMPAVPGDLPGHHVFLPDEIGCRHNVRLDSDGGSVAVRINPRLVINNSDALISATESGGIALLPTFSVNSLIAAGRLRRVLPQWIVKPKKEVAIYLISARKTRISLLARTFIDFVMAEIDASGW
ncbi:LysR family transcriptional regulator [Methylobacterium sp. JK268]